MWGRNIGGNNWRRLSHRAETVVVTHWRRLRCRAETVAGTHWRQLKRGAETVVGTQGKAGNDSGRSSITMTGGGRPPCQEACNHDVRRMASTVFGQSMHQVGERWYIDLRCKLEGTGRQRRRTQKASVDGFKMVDVRRREKMVDVRGGHRRQVLMVSRW